jgi:hypothetical protein
MPVNLGEAIERCKLHVRRNTWLTDPDWVRLIDSACQEIQSQTHYIQATSNVLLEEGVSEYDLSASRIYRLTRPPVLDGETLMLTSQAAVARYLADPENGKPVYAYEARSGFLGLYPVPDADSAGKSVSITGNAWPQRMTPSTPLSTTLPFDEGAHDTIVYGALLLAERIDTDVTVSEMVRSQYQSGIVALRARAANLTPGTKYMKRWF